MSEREKERAEGEDSANTSQQIVSDDDEIDYSSKPEFYDSKLDDNDELWTQKQRRGNTSDAVLSCPAFFTTLCLECQRHEKYVTQYRAFFVVNCKIMEKELSKRKRNKRGYQTEDPESAGTIRCVCCAVCSTDVGVIDEEAIYHFLNVLPSEA